MADSLIAFLHAQLDEDERLAHAALAGPWVRRVPVAGVHADDAGPEHPFGTPVADCRQAPGGYEKGLANASHIAHHDPARILEEVAAKRRLLDEFSRRLSEIRARAGSVHGEADWYDGRAYGLLTAVVMLARTYRSHPAFHSDWLEPDRLEGL